VDCNKYIKFKKIFECANELDYYYIATGHYARVCEVDGRYLLKKGADIKKDQSYVLYNLTQEQLARVRFPLGGLSKPEVREIAQANNFINAGKRESQDICFVADGDYAGYIEKYTGRIFPDGDFSDISGNILGRHKGIIRYTNGQRRGLGLAFKEPMYVLNKNVETNVVTLCTNSELYSKSLIARNINLIALDKIERRLKIKARARYNQSEQPATAEQTGADELRIEFDNPQRALTRGQSVVLYDGDIVIGGGTIV
jgi:tRNA-specific 2-thiouridylase